MSQSKKGFSFIELILILVFFFIILASLMPMITRRHSAPPEKVSHGTYACYWEKDETGNVLKETLIRGRATIKDNVPAEGGKCSFESPSKARYFYVQLIGGGGGGKEISMDDINPAVVEKYRIFGTQSGADYYIVEDHTDGKDHDGWTEGAGGQMLEKEYQQLVSGYSMWLHTHSTAGSVCTQPSSGSSKTTDCDQGKIQDFPFCQVGVPAGCKVDLSDCPGCQESEGNYRVACPSGTSEGKDTCSGCANLKIKCTETDPPTEHKLQTQIAWTGDTCYNDKAGSAAPEGYKKVNLSTSGWTSKPFHKYKNVGSTESLGNCSYGEKLWATGGYTKSATLSKLSNGDGYYFVYPGGGVGLSSCGGQGAERGVMEENNPRYHRSTKDEPSGAYEYSKNGSEFCSAPETYSTPTNNTTQQIRNGYFSQPPTQYEKPAYSASVGFDYETLKFSDFKGSQSQVLPYGVGGKAGELKTMILKSIPEGVEMLPGQGGLPGHDGGNTLFGSNAEGSPMPLRVAHGGKAGGNVYTVDVPIGPYGIDDESVQTKEKTANNRVMNTSDMVSRNGGTISYSTFVRFVISYTNKQLRDRMAYFGQGGMGTSIKTDATCGYKIDTILFMDGDNPLRFILRGKQATSSKGSDVCDYSTDTNVVCKNRKHVSSSKHIRETFPDERVLISPANFTKCNGHRWIKVTKPEDSEFDEEYDEHNDPTKGYHWGYYEGAMDVDKQASGGQSGAIVISW